MHEWHAKTRPKLPPYTSFPDLILKIRPDPNARMYRTQAQRIWRAEARAKVLYFFNTLSFETEEYYYVVEFSFPETKTLLRSSSSIY